jgi:tetratricopeptide (TPR) repeat protein
MTRVILVLLFFSAVVVRAAEVDAPGSYESALKLYQEQKYVDAEAQFRQFAATHPNNKFAHYNWGLAAYQTGLKGMAVAAWRRALNIDPDFSPALAALRFARTEMPNEVFAASANRWEELRATLLERTTLDRFFGITILLFIFAGALGMRFFGARHRAFRDELPLPPFPTVGALFGAGFVLAASLTVAKYFADEEVRATIVKTGISVRSGPSDQDNSLFEIIEGVQVIVRQKAGDWTMVTYPGGLSGWVPSNSLFITSQRG